MHNNRGSVNKKLYDIFLIAQKYKTPKNIDIWVFIDIGIFLEGHIIYIMTRFLKINKCEPHTSMNNCPWIKKITVLLDQHITILHRKIQCYKQLLTNIISHFLINEKLPKVSLKIFFEVLTIFFLKLFEGRIKNKNKK